MFNRETAEKERAGAPHLSPLPEPALSLASSVSLPRSPAKPTVLSAPPAKEGLLHNTSRDVLAGNHADSSAFMLIPENDEALRWRLALIDSATVSIDLQVFIWSDDESGRLLLNRILDASKRGVRVRLLIDDMPKDWPDLHTALVARQPNVSIRRFNPGRIRRGLIARILQMTTQFRSLNRRMHNKQLIVDGTWAIVGGRNMGNPYFGLSKKYNNRDLDVLLTGNVIGQMAGSFDEYWNADATYPGQAMAGNISPLKQEKQIQTFSEQISKDRELLSKTSIPAERKSWSAELAELPESMVPGTATFIQDAPIVKGDRGVRLIDQFDSVLGVAHRRTSIITPYMIPGKRQLQSIQEAIKEGREIRILVPAMDSNNHTMAHSHYEKYRKKLLRTGVRLYEFSGYPGEDMRKMSNTSPIEAGFISLHTKAFILDDRRVLLGSLNVDPRSIQINTEQMVVMESPRLAQNLLAQFDEMTAPGNAWELHLNDKGKVRWKSGMAARKLQPAQGFIQRFQATLYKILPIEGQL